MPTRANSGRIYAFRSEITSSLLANSLEINEPCCGKQIAVETGCSDSASEVTNWIRCEVIWPSVGIGYVFLVTACRE